MNLLIRLTKRTYTVFNRFNKPEGHPLLLFSGIATDRAAFADLRQDSVSICYPRGLKGKEILTEAQILTVADVVEAMASHRPYRPDLGIDAALNEIEKNRGIFYNNNAADACLRLFREKGFKLGDA